MARTRLSIVHVDREGSHHIEEEVDNLKYELREFEYEIKKMARNGGRIARMAESHAAYFISARKVLSELAPAIEGRPMDLTDK